MNNPKNNPTENRMAMYLDKEVQYLTDFAIECEIDPKPDTILLEAMMNVAPFGWQRSTVYHADIIAFALTKGLKVAIMPALGNGKAPYSAMLVGE